MRRLLKVALVVPILGGAIVGSGPSLLDATKGARINGGDPILECNGNATDTYACADIPNGGSCGTSWTGIKEELAGASMTVRYDNDTRACNRVLQCPVVYNVKVSPNKCTDPNPPGP